MLSLVTNLNNSTAQEIVDWVMTADGCVHTADASAVYIGLNFYSARFRFRYAVEIDLFEGL